MWRSLFFALGIALMVLGAEALVFERFVIAPTAHLPKFLNGIYEKGMPDSFALDNGSQLSPFSANAQAVSANGRSFRLPNYSQSSQVSQFGPSRFSGPQNGDYGGGRVDLSRSGLNANSNQSGGPAAFPISFGNDQSIANNAQNNFANPVSRTIITKDWMPWSLLAAGAIIFLYTSSHRRHREE